MEVAVGTSNSNDTPCEKKQSPPCRPRKQLEYVISCHGRDDENYWRCPACHAHYEDPVCLSCGDTLCRACVTAIGGICPTCNEKLIAEQLLPSRLAQRLVKQMQCHCPNRGLGCTVLIGVLDVEHHLRAECEWREEECDQCHQQVRRAEMARHKDTTCAHKLMACGYADVGCPTRCAQEDLAAHERDGVVAHMGLLRQRLAVTSADLTQCKADLTQTQGVLTLTQHDQAATASELTATRADLTQTQHDLAQTRAGLSQTQAQLAESRAEVAQCKADLSQTQHELAALRSQIDQLFTPPAAPEGLAARWDEATKEVALDWRPVSGIPAVAAPVGDPAAAACCALAAAAAPPPPGPPIRYRVQATLVVAGGDPGITGMVVYTGPECRCRYRFPPDATPGRAAEARFVVVAMRGLTEGGPSAPATCSSPDHCFTPPPSPITTAAVVFTYDHDMDDRGLFYSIGTQGRTQPWRNPAEAGWVTATRSSEGAGKPSDLTGRQPCDSWTANQPNSWWQVDLGAGRLFTPTRYTLRHSNFPGHVPSRLQSWRLEGSVDGASWRTLDEHTNAIPARPDAMATFAVAPERAFPARRFRVLMTGPNPDGYHYLVLSGLEMYGSLRDLSRR
ncbi:putative E3 ubiquitin-protein ligase HECTD1 [Paratrimastix pyriformis]|uniref:E3 ubiquitin-protein ligase HECTD1 n=1 Tax=Paratrimastix pyriformis TaxID=342808 RepID=A0ABQ8ULX9_9EUKA|nr:putative E3 ubiquitin-protein ligase HECTD1 [Paratrimastix pyriformis]